MSGDARLKKHQTVSDRFSQPFHSSLNQCPSRIGLALNYALANLFEIEAHKKTNRPDEGPRNLRWAYSEDSLFRARPISGKLALSGWAQTKYAQANKIVHISYMT